MTVQDPRAQRRAFRARQRGMLARLREVHEALSHWSEFHAVLKGNGPCKASASIAVNHTGSTINAMTSAIAPNRYPKKPTGSCGLNLLCA